MPATAMGEAYLDLLEQVLTGVFMEDPPIATEGYRNLYREMMRSMNSQREPTDADLAEYRKGMRENGMDWPSRALTMIGRRRLRNFRTLLADVIERNVPGDILEAGVWRGGASIMARAVLRAHEDAARRLFVADSFEGLPPPDPKFQQDAGSDFHEYADLAVSLETVKGNFQLFGLLDDRVQFLKGWFRDTMPTAPLSQLAVMRLDGDMYESTIDPLQHLYDKVSAGGWIIVDDYFLPPCKAAVSDFLGARALAPEIINIDNFGAYFQKP